MRGKTTFHIRWKLFFYDVIVFAVTSVFLLVLYEGPVKLTQRGELQQMLLAFVCVFACRLVGKIYGQIWRYGGIQCYMRLVCTDCVAFLIYVILESVLPVAHISFPRLLVLSTVNTMGALIMRMSYRYAYKCSNLETFSGKILAALLKIFAGIEVGETRDDQKIKVAIIGAGNVGVTLAGELLANKMASYVPKCFVDIDKSKDGREIQGLPVLSENEATFQKLKKYGIQEIIFALPSMADERRTERYLYYKNAGYKVKMYDYPKMQMAGGKRALREFDIEELLFRAPRKLTNEKTKDYYNNKVILITGGGGSIGSELCRQIVKMGPEKLIILDIYENGAYDLLQELRIAYGNEPGLSVEIASITDSRAMERVFQKYHPQIVINAAAHKHVPLMENNCIEAIKNNVFGTAVVVEMCEKYGAERFMMVSTDKAVNPTNVMGATKRMCEMIVQSASINGKVKYSATRFGNVLGSFAKMALDRAESFWFDKRPLYHYVQSEESAVRGKFRKSQLTIMRLYDVCIPFYKEKYPELLNGFFSYMAGQLISIFYDMWSDETDFKDEQSELVKVYEKYYKEAIKCKEVSKKQKLKYRIFHWSPMIFCRIHKILWK